MRKMLTPKDIEEIMGFGKKKTMKIINCDGFPKIQIGRSVLIPEDEFEKWIQVNIGKTIEI